MAVEKKEKNVKKEVAKKKKVVEKKVVEKKAIPKNAEKKSNENRLKKKVAEKNENLFEKLKKFVSSYSFLYGLFGILVVLVIFLSVKVVIVKSEAKKNSSNIVFPILEENSHSSMNINLKELEKAREYVIKVTNYRGNTINQEEIPYSVTIRNKTKAKIEVLKDSDENNLMVDQEATVIEGVSLGSNHKEESVYRIRVLDSKGISKEDIISVEIAS